MALFTSGALTKKGQALIAKSEANGTGIKITKAVTGSGTHKDTSPEAIEKLEKLTAPVQTFAISDLTTVQGNEGQVIITVVVNNRGLEKMYYLNELGIYAEDPDDGEILYCVILSENNTVYIPPDNESGGVSTITERIYLEVTNADRTTIETNGAVVSATDFAELRDLVEKVTKGLQGGSAGQILEKESEDGYDYTWLDKNTIARPIAEFPEKGQTDAIYIDTDASEIYVWKLLSSGEYGYFKLPLGAEASETLQKQITENASRITYLLQYVQNVEFRVDTIEGTVELTVPASGWKSSTEDGIAVYTNDITIDGIASEFDAVVYPRVISTTAAAITKELEAIGMFFSKGISESTKTGVHLVCYKKCPKVDFGITLQGVVPGGRVV